MERNRELRIPIHQIEPAGCHNPKAVPRYAAMLRAGSKPPSIWVVQQGQPNSFFRYRILDGAHRVRAATLCGHTKIRARLCL